MILNTKKLHGKSFLAIAIYSAFTYFFAHMAYLYMNSDTGVTFEYISLYIGKITDFIIPIAIATVAFILYINESSKRALAFTLVAASARIFYHLPYYYIIFIYNYGYDSVESITLSFILSLAIIAFDALSAFLCIWLSLFIIKRLGKQKNEAADNLDLVTLLKKEQSPYDFTNGINLALAIFALYRFVCAIIPETFDTVSFFIEYKFDVLPIEIITIMCNYLLIFAMLFVSYILAIFIRKWFFTAFTKTDDEVLNQINN